MTCRSGQLCTTIFELKWYFETHISPLTNAAPPGGLNIAVGRIVILSNCAALPDVVSDWCVDPFTHK